jgi:quercetin dioxygenase-like cupin family protein
MTKGRPLGIDAAFERLTFLGTRTPQTRDLQEETFAGQLAEYRNGGVYVSHFAGLGEWERHPGGDEIVMVIEGEAVASLIEAGREVTQPVQAGQLIVIPENTWHRFETAGVKLLTVTPKPTDHRIEFPE